MRNFAKAFRRNPDGSWTRIAAATWSGPNGRIQVNVGSSFAPGFLYMGVDLAMLLNDEASSPTAG
jgi:hypothetical protein